MGCASAVNRKDDSTPNGDDPTKRIIRLDL